MGRSSTGRNVSSHRLQKKIYSIFLNRCSFSVKIRETARFLKNENKKSLVHHLDLLSSIRKRNKSLIDGFINIIFKEPIQVLFSLPILPASQNPAVWREFFIGYDACMFIVQISNKNKSENLIFLPLAQTWRKPRMLNRNHLQLLTFLIGIRICIVIK